MNITQEQVADNHVKLVVNLLPDDYMNKVNNEIKTLSKKITLDGFRPGKVPPGLAKKYYGKSVLVDELNKIINDSVMNYIREKDLKVLGQPLPYEVRQQPLDIQHPEAYDFGFEVGLIPQFELPLLVQKPFEKKVIRITDEMIHEEVERLQSVYGQRSYPEVAGDEDILNGEWKELNENDEVKEDGISSTSSFSLKIVKDDVSKQLLQNLKKEESTLINIKAAFGNDMELIIHNILKIDHHDAEVMKDRFRFTLKNIIHIDKAEINQELFDKAFTPAVVNSEDEMKEKIRNDLKNEYSKYSLSRLDRELQSYLINETKMELPVEFIRRLINTNKEEGQTDIDDHELVQYVQQVKWDLIHDRLVRDHDINVTKDELAERVKKDIANYYGGQSVFEKDPDALNRLASSLINDEKYVSKIRKEVLNDKIFELLKLKILIEEKEVDQHEFFHH